MNDKPSAHEDDTISEEPTFYIQVGGAPGSAVRPEMSAEDFIRGTQEQFKRIAEVVEAAGQSFVVRINQLASKPTQCSIEFGVNVGGEAGIPFVTKGTIGANFKVCISWGNKD